MTDTTNTPDALDAAIELGIVADEIPTCVARWREYATQARTAALMASLLAMYAERLADLGAPPSAADLPSSWREAESRREWAARWGYAVHRSAGGLLAEALPPSEMIGRVIMPARLDLIFGPGPASIADPKESAAAMLDAAGSTTTQVRSWWAEAAADAQRARHHIERRGSNLSLWLTDNGDTDPEDPAPGVPWLVGPSGWADLAHLVDRMREAIEEERRELRALWALIASGGAACRRHASGQA
jgi:hypothetical protein